MGSGRILTKFFLTCALMVGGLAVAAPAQAALTPAQVGTIINLLVSFNVDQATIAKVQASLVGSSSAGAPAGTVSLAPGAQPADARVAPSKKQLPFTTFVLTNNTTSAVTVGGITVTRTGSALDSSLTDVELLDSTGKQIGSSQDLDFSHQATVGGALTLSAGEVKTLTVAGDIAARNRVHTGKTLSLEVGAVNISAALYGSLPIVGASYTIDTTLK